VYGCGQELLLITNYDAVTCASAIFPRSSMLNGLGDLPVGLVFGFAVTTFSATARVPVSPVSSPCQ
jgi:hypothetical protein